jgi:serine/threonine protein kinase/Tol biopolymer transport system component
MAGVSSRGPRLFRFAPFELDVRAGELRKHGIRLKLREQPVRILEMLLATPGDVVLRDEIRRCLWPNNTVVEFDHAINVAILHLRNALEDSANTPRYVETVGRRGYRFIGEVEPCEAPAPELEPETAERAEADPGDLSGQTLSHFRLIGKLGGGGMGVVYRAEDLKLGRQVALKFLPLPAEEAPTEMLERFRREARAASSLSHPNICTIHGVEELAGQPVIVMELLEGETLQSRLTHGALAAETALALAIPLASALDAAHRKGIVHRDLKPANIMLTAQPAGATVKVLDFGLAKTERAPAGVAALAAPISQAGAILGTCDYMSPEQVQGLEADARSDIFSFGLVLYEMLAGRHTFQGGTAVEVMNAILKEDPPALPETVPAGLRQVVADCLEKDPGARFDTAHDLLFALRALEAGPVSGVAWRAGPAARAGRKRWLVPVLLTVIAGLAALSLSLYVSLSKPLDLSTYRFTPVATEAEDENRGTWSPDGKSIAYLKYVGGRPQVMVRSLTSVSPRQLTRLEAGVNLSVPFFSRDGERVYFIAQGALWSVAAVGGEPREMLKAPMGAATLSPDGRTLAFWKKYEEDGKVYSGLWISSPPGASPRKYRPAPFRVSGGFYPNFLRFSPDGSKIALSTYRIADEAWVWSLPWPDGPKAQPRQLFAGRRFQGPVALDWMPDSRHLCLSIEGSLWLGDARSGKLQRMTATATERAGQPSVAPGGDQVLFTAFTSDLDVVEIPLDGSPPRPLLATARNESSPSWNAAGDAMAYITDRSGKTEIWLRSPSGNWDVPVVRQSDFPDDPGKLFGSVALSPNGKRLAYVRHDRVWISPVSGGRPSPAVLSGKTAPVAPSWSPDSASVALIGGGSFSVAVMRIGSEQPLFVLPDTAGVCASPPVWSPDGRWIACGTHMQTVLLVSPDGKERRSLPSPVRISYLNSVLLWSRDAATIYLASSQTPGARLDAVDVRTGKSRKLAEYGPNLEFRTGATYSLCGSLSRDGKSFATTVINERSDLWMLEGFLPRPGRLWF